MKYVWVAQSSNYLEVFKIKRLAEEEMKKQGLIKHKGFWVDVKGECGEYDVSISRCRVRK